MSSLLLWVCVALAASSCGLHLASGAPTAFDAGALNATWTSGYQRALSTESGRAAAAAPAREESTARASSRAAEPDRPASRPAPAAASSPPSPARPSRSGAGSGPFSPELAAAYVEAVYALNETRVATTSSPGIVDIYRHAQQTGAIYHTPRPAVGDLVFFHNTFDRNGDGRNNDWYTHIGIVEDVDDAGTVSFLSYLGGEVQRHVLNLESPSVGREGSRVLNSELRAPASGDPDFTQRLAGELFAGFGSLLGDREEVVVIDNWQPGSTVNLQAAR